MTDVRTGQTFAISDFAGKVVLVETMAEWCPTCIEQQREVGKLHDLLAGSTDVVSVSLDIDVHEDGPSLKEYATKLGYDWHFAVAPLEMARALGNLYSAEYLNPPYSPMLLIDRNGAVTSLPYGVKTADYLRAAVEQKPTP
jgi:thiol-disulfide isomerase/thioredoxin